MSCADIDLNGRTVLITGRAGCIGSNLALYVEDVVQANLQALTAPQSGVYNVGSGQAREFRELLEILQRVLGTQQEVAWIDNPWEFYQDHTAADIAETMADLGYAPRFTLEAGIDSCAAEIRRLAKPTSPPSTAV